VSALAKRFSCPDETRLLLIVAATFIIGIPIDALGAWWSQPLVTVGVWAVLAWVTVQSTPLHRRELAACLLLATLGELFLMDVWGLYEYRLGNLPLFIPPGHALAFTAAVRLSRRVPDRFPWIVAALAGPYLAWSGWTGVDTQGPLWFLVFLGYMIWGREQRLYGVAFVLALGVEAYGTSLGGWRYFPVEPWFGLTTTNPPICIGAIYCTLEVMVRKAGQWQGWAPRDAASPEGLTPASIEGRQLGEDVPELVS
jgi:hypothetical protein